MDQKSMKRMWAPWRMHYIQKINRQKKKCIFCEAYKSKNKKDKLVVAKSKQSLALLNLFPYNNGHIMVAPRRHVADLEKLTTSELLALWTMVKELVAALKKIFRPAGFNIGINIGKEAGAGIDQHLHIHIVPRWTGDTNFMPVCSSTKVISQSLSELYGLLKKCLHEKK